MKKMNIELENDRQYREEYVMCRKKHLVKLTHKYVWVGSGASREFVVIPVSADVIVVRYHHNGGDETEISLVRIQNGRKEELFYSEDLEDYGKFQEMLENLKKKGFQRIEDSDYAAQDKNDVEISIH